MNHAVIVAVIAQVTMNICAMVTQVMLITCMRKSKMKYEMQNFIKFSKTKASNVGQSKRNDDWKRERKIARKQKQQQRKVAR